jgi:hypothetical protein
MDLRLVTLAPALDTREGIVDRERPGEDTAVLALTALGLRRYACAQGWQQR